MAKATLVKPPAFVEKLTKALQRELRGSEVHIEQVRKDRYRFIVVWRKFDKMDHPERQQIVWKIAEKVVPGEMIWNVSMILTLGLDDLPQDE